MNGELEFFAEVDISDAPTLDRDIANQRGAIIGKSQDKETKDWFYTVMVYGLGEAVVIPGKELRPTGRIVPRESIYTGESRRVVVDPETGEGNLAD